MICPLSTSPEKGWIPEGRPRDGADSTQATLEAGFMVGTMCWV